MGERQLQLVERFNEVPQAHALAVIAPPEVALRLRRARRRNILTEAGAEMLAAARTTHLAGVRSLFLQHFSDDELEVLGDAWDRVVPGSASAPGPTCG